MVRLNYVYIYLILGYRCFVPKITQANRLILINILSHTFRVYINRGPFFAINAWLACNFAVQIMFLVCCLFNPYFMFYNLIARVISSGSRGDHALLRICVEHFYINSKLFSNIIYCFLNKYQNNVISIKLFMVNVGTIFIKYSTSFTKRIYAT